MATYFYFRANVKGALIRVQLYLWKNSILDAITVVFFTLVFSETFVKI